MGRHHIENKQPSNKPGHIKVIFCHFIDHRIFLAARVCVFSSHSFWTSSSSDVPAGVTQEEGHTGFLIHPLSAVRALIFLARRTQPFLSLVDREVDFFCVLKPTFMGTKNLYENGPNPFFLFGTKYLVRVKLMAAVLFRHGFDN